ncbi:MAG: hypothetical protein J6S42_08515, partial [Thermoguttaceae bacterium]|nr:hypothetical protein [Thermoguttaceae bacterium]
HIFPFGGVSFRSPSRRCGTFFLAALLALVPLFYGCGWKKTSSEPEIPEKNLSESSPPSETSPESGSEIPSLSAEDLSDLGNATDRFAELFQDSAEQEKDEGAAPAAHSLGAVSTEAQEEYTRLPDILFTPQIIDKKEDDSQRYLLRYRFEPDSDQRWNVAHRVRKKVLMSGLETEIETVSQIVRRWHIEPHSADLPADLETVTYFIDEMILDQQETGKDPIRYDSRVDDEVPAEISVFGTEKAVGQEISRFKIDQFGMMTEKEKMIQEYGGSPKDSRLLFPFPEEPVAVGETWTLPYTIFLQNRDKTVKTINAILKFTLTNVAGDLAVIEVRTVPTSIIGDPYLEGQLAERLFTGSCRLDMKSGKAIKTEVEFSRSVPEAYGTATFLDYRCRITEEAIPETP